MNTGNLIIYHAQLVPPPSRRYYTAPIKYIRNEEEPIPKLAIAKANKAMGWFGADLENLYAAGWLEEIYLTSTCSLAPEADWEPDYRKTPEDLSLIRSWKESGF